MKPKLIKKKSSQVIVVFIIGVKWIYCSFSIAGMMTWTLPPQQTEPNRTEPWLQNREPNRTVPLVYRYTPSIHWMQCKSGRYEASDCVWEIKCAIQMSCNCSQKALWKPATDLKLSIKALTSSELLPSVPTGPPCVTLEHQLHACWLQCICCEFQVKCVPYVHPCWATAGVRWAGPHRIRHHRIGTPVICRALHIWIVILTTAVWL